MTRASMACLVWLVFWTTALPHPAAATVLDDEGDTAAETGGESATFSGPLETQPGGAQVEIGDYRATVGGAEKSMDECLRASEGSSTPPSCLSGLTVEPKRFE
jgi:hypothetical protein